MRSKGSSLTLNSAVYICFSTGPCLRCCCSTFRYSLSRSNFHQPFIMVRVKASERKKMCAMEQDHFFCVFFALLWSFSCHPKTSSTTRARARSFRFAQLIVKRRILRCFCHFLSLVARAPKRENETKKITSETMCTLHAQVPHFFFTSVPSTASAKALQYRFHSTSISK